MIWCDRALWQCRYAFGLCLNEKDFHKQLKVMSVPTHEWASWITPGADATTHFLTHPEGARAAIVCFNTEKKLNGIQIASVLVHEAVHIWQEHRRAVGEHEPADESEAYAIQALSQRLMEAYAEAKK